MTPKEYMEKVKEFSDYPRLEWPLYPLVLLAEESEELYSAIDENAPVESILRECGDCLWAYTAAWVELCPEMEYSDEVWNYRRTLAGLSSHDDLFKEALAGMRRASKLLGRVHKWMRGDPLAKVDICRQLSEMDVGGFIGVIFMLGYSIQEVAQMNIDKLEDRRARNTLKGDGNYR